MAQSVREFISALLNNDIDLTSELVVQVISEDEGASELVREVVNIEENEDDQTVLLVK